MEVDAKDVLSRVVFQLNCLPMCLSDFLGRDLYRDVQTVLYGGPDDDEGENENSDEI